MKTTLSESVQSLLIGNLLGKHPLPWIVERDWTWEVLDACHRVVAKFPCAADARNLVDYATELDAELRASDLSYRILMREAGLDPDE